MTLPDHVSNGMASYARYKPSVPILHSTLGNKKKYRRKTTRSGNPLLPSLNMKLVLKDPLFRGLS